MPVVESSGKLLKQVSISKLLESLTAEFSKDIQNQIDCFSSNIQEKTLQDFNVFKQEIIKATKTKIDEISNIGKQMDSKALLHHPNNDRGRLVERKRLNNGLELISKVQSHILDISQRFIESLEQIKTKQWKAVRYEYIIGNSHCFLSHLTRYKQHLNISREYSKRLDKLTQDIVDLMKSPSNDSCVALIDQTKRTLIDLQFDIKSSFSQLEYLDTKMEYYLELVYSSTLNQLKKEDFNDILHLQVLSDLKAPLSSTERYRRELNQILDVSQDEISKNLSILTILMSQLELKNQALKLAETILNSISSEKQKLKDNCWIEITKHEHDMQRIQDCISASKKFQEIQMLSDQFESVIRQLSGDQDRLFQDIVATASIFSTALEKNKMSILKSQSQNLDELYFCLKDFGMDDTQFDEELWRVDEKIFDNVEDQMELVVFESKNELNECLYRNEIRAEVFVEKFVEPRTATLRQQLKDQQDEIQRLSKELFNIRFDFDEKFLYGTAKAKEYIKDLERAATSLGFVPRSSIEAFIRDTRTKFSTKNMEISTILKEASENFSNRYSVMQRYQYAQNLADEDKDKDDGWLTDHKIWTTAVETAEKTSGELKLEYAKLMTIRLKDWLTIYQNKWNVQQHAIKRAEDGFMSISTRVMTECKAVNAIECEIEGFSRELKNKVRFIKAIHAMTEQAKDDEQVQQMKTDENIKTVGVYDEKVAEITRKYTAQIEEKFKLLEASTLQETFIRREISPNLQAYQDEISNRMGAIVKLYNQEIENLGKK